MRMKCLCTVLSTCAMICLVTAANAAVNVKFVAAGSSAMWQSMGIASKTLCGSTCSHWTAKGKTTGGNNWGQLSDSRNSSIVVEPGNLWVVWDSAQANVWAYLSVDSVVGNRCFFANPRCKLQVDSTSQSTAGQGLISAALWGADAASIPAAIYAAINNASLTAAGTDIRPEDAKFEECRVNSILDTVKYTGLGYNTAVPSGTCPVFSDPVTHKTGTAITSAVTGSTAKANPVAFNIIAGTADPFDTTGNTFLVKKSVTIPVGADAIVFLANRKNTTNGLGTPLGTTFAVTNITDSLARTIFEGTNCNGSVLSTHVSAPIFPWLREPLSGTYTTTEFTVVRNTGAAPHVFTTHDAQEDGVNPANANNNPLNLPCTGSGSQGKRQRGIGTGEVMNGVGTAGGVLNTTDGLGYAFYSFGNVSKLAGSASYGYLTLDGTDPIFLSYTGTEPGQNSKGQLPTCTAPCPVSKFWSNSLGSFPNLRNGTYRAWSIVRIVTDVQPSGTCTTNPNTNFCNAQAVVTQAQSNVNNTVPDFVPFTSLTKYRSHYTQSGIAPNNGLGGQTEAGGDVGGCIEPVGPPPGVTNQVQKTAGSSPACGTP
jgi:hypothetical protein